MGIFDMFEGHDNKQSYDEAYGGQEHEGSWTHEALGGAAAFAAMHEYEKHQEETGEPVNHAVAKEMLAAVAGAEVDKLVETKGLDYIDREKAKSQAQQQAEQMLYQAYPNEG